MNAAEIKKQLEILEQAKALVIILGGGVVLFGAVDECIGFAEYTQIPVRTTYMVRKVYLTILTLMVSTSWNGQKHEDITNGDKYIKIVTGED